MRVLQVVQQPALRGAEVFAKQLSEALRERGHVVRTVYLYASSDSRLPLHPDDVVLGASPSDPLERLAVQPGVVVRLAELVAGFDPDIVQLNGGRAVKYGAALRHTRRRGNWAAIYRNIGDPGYWIRGAVKRAAYRYGVFSGIDGIVSLSERSSTAFREGFGVRAPLEVIPNGVSPKELEPRRARASVRAELGTEEAAPVALFVGSLSPEKRLDRLVSAFGRVHAALPSSRLWIIGEGRERASLVRLVEELGLEGAVSFIGSTREVGSYYAAADVFALTSDTEGIPGVLLEAAYAGLPIVSTDVGLVRDCVLDGESALLTSPDVTAFAGALQRLLDDEALRQRLGERGRALVRERFLIASIAERYERFYGRVLGDSVEGRR